MYRYEDLKPTIFTDDGQRLFLKIRDRAKHLLATAGAVRLEELIHGSTGDTWHMLACVDRLVELHEIVELTYPNFPDPPGQWRVFVKAWDGAR